jgi:acyl-CoA dehydrogenase
MAWDFSADPQFQDKLDWVERFCQEKVEPLYGTGEQKKRWLGPLLNQDMFSAFSMTEPQGGSDPDRFKTHATQDGDEWVINGEKWFTSAGRVADLLFVMCTNGMFVVPRATPGVEIMPEPRNHNHILYRDVRVPLDRVLAEDATSQMWPARWLRQ